MRRQLWILQYWTQYGENIELLSQTSAESLGVTQENYNALMEHLRSGDQEAAGLAQSIADNIKSGNAEAVSALANTIGEVDSKQKEVSDITQLTLMHRLYKIKRVQLFQLRRA